MEKEIIVNSFSAGESSGYQSWLLNVFYKDKYEMINIFMNTGLEDEQTLLFADQCDKAWGLNLIYLEAVINPVKRKVTTHRIVDFKTASRKGQPFIEMVKKYGLPNFKFPHCTRELKLRVFESYCKENLKGINYKTAIGIIADEVDRVSPNHKKNKLFYPLISEDVTKVDVNIFWRDMPFRLTIKGYEGNCTTCVKKSLRKLLTVAKYHPEAFDIFKELELLFPDYRFYRDKLTVSDIIRMSKEPFEEAVDDRTIYIQHKQTKLFGYNLDTVDSCTESCEVF